MRTVYIYIYIHIFAHICTYLHHIYNGYINVFLYDLMMSSSNLRLIHVFSTLQERECVKKTCEFLEPRLSTQGINTQTTGFRIFGLMDFKFCINDIDTC